MLTFQNLCRKIPQPRPAAPAKRNEPEKSIFASLLETISSTLTKTVENIEKQKLEDIDTDGDRDQVLKTTTATTTTTATATEKDMEITTEAPETTSRYIGGGRRHEENDVLETSEATSANQTENGDIVEGKKSAGVVIESGAAENDKHAETKEEEEVFVDYSNDNDWTPLSPHGRLVVGDDD